MKSLISQGIFFSLLCITPAFAGQLTWFTYFDPYYVLTGLRIQDTAGLNPTGYYGQMDSLGITLTHSTADAISTANSYGIKIMGQDGLMKVRNIDFPFLVHAGHNVIAQVENGDEVQLGYNWMRRGAYEPTIDLAGYNWSVSSSSADTILTSLGGKFMMKYNRNVYPRARMMISDVASTDTICDFIFYYRTIVDSVNVYRVATRSLRGVDFQSAGVWQEQSFASFFHYGSGGYQFRVFVYWRGTHDLAIDNISYHDDAGMSVSSGVYVSRIQTDQVSQTRKMLLVK